MNGTEQSRKTLCDIAHTAFGAINRLLERDQRFAGELRSEETGSFQIYREECLTAEMAVELALAFPDHVTTTVFTPREESKNGADWYWRIEKDGGAIHAQVQAKRVRRTAAGQRDADGRIHIDHPQLSKLIAEAETARIKLPELQAWIATFARFRAEPPCRKVDLQECRLHRHPVLCQEHEASVWIGDAGELNAKLPAVAPVRTVVGESLRLDCLLPCIELDPKGRVGPNLKGLRLKARLLAYQDCLDIIANDVTLSSHFEGAMMIRV